MPTSKESSKESATKSSFSVRNLAEDDKFKALSPEVRMQVFDRVASQDEEYRGLEPSVRAGVRRRLTAESPGERRDRIAGEREFVKVDGPLSLLTNASQALQREEAAVAAPILQKIKARKAVFGSEKDTRSTPDVVRDALEGRSFSSHRNEGQVEFGDIFREAGYPEPLAATLGLIATEALPSTQAMNLVAGGPIGRQILKKSGKAKKAVVDKLLEFKRARGQKVTSKEAQEYLGAFRKTFQDLEKEANLPTSATAEVFESLTNIPSDEILYAMKNPEILTKAMARPELTMETAHKVGKEVMKSVKKNPEMFEVDETVPKQIAERISDRFNGMVKEAGSTVRTETLRMQKELAEQEFKTGVKRGVPVSQVQARIDNVLEEGNFLIQGTNKVKPQFKDNPVVKSLMEMKDKVKETSKTSDSFVTVTKQKPMGIGKDGNVKFKNVKVKERVMGIEELMDTKKLIDEVAFKTAVVDQSGVFKPLPEVERSLRRVRGGVNDIIKTEYNDFPDLMRANQRFSELAEIRSDLSTTLRKSDRMASFLRKIDNKNPEDMHHLGELLGAVPNGENYLVEVSNFLDLKANSLASRMPFLVSRDERKVTEGLSAVFKKSFERDLSPELAQDLSRIQNITGLSFVDDLIAQRVARSFAGKSNMFRALAAGGTVAGAAGLSGGGAGGALVSFAGGYALTDPRVVRFMIRNTAKAKRAGAVAARVNRPLLGAEVRRFIETRDQRDERARRSRVFLR